MTELGIRLKEAREEKAMSLDDLQAATKIQKRYLTALEEGNYDIIPVGSFMFGHSSSNMQKPLGLMRISCLRSIKKISLKRIMMMCLKRSPA